jgi:hypothetical protein
VCSSDLSFYSYKTAIHTDVLSIRQIATPDHMAGKSTGEPRPYPLSQLSIAVDYCICQP